MNSIERHLRAGWKYLLSFRKRDWALEDYPFYTRQQKQQFGKPARLQLEPWVASIVNWGLAGVGKTEVEAVEGLRKALEEVRKNREKIPRPGTSVPVEFASQEQISRYADLSEEFLRKILDVEWGMITDESTLWDFHEEETNEKYITRIRKIYGVDVAGIESGNLVEIFARIKQRSEPSI